MKLSMWMIANRLRDMDVSVHIRRNAPIHLKSARMVYSTDCVHVYRKGKDVFCEDNGDVIIIRNADVNESFDLIQSVFDYYQDLVSLVEQALENNNLQEAIDSCWLYFRNPLVVLDTDMQYLARSSQYSEEDLGMHWKFLVEPHYPSPSTINVVPSENPDDFFQPNFVKSCRLNSNTMTCECYTAAIFHENSFTGRIALLEDSYQLNKGDSQLLGWLVTKLAPLLGKLKTSEFDWRRDILFEEVIGTNVRPEILDNFIGFYGWKPDDGFLVHVFKPKSPEDETALDALQLDLYDRMKACHTSVFEGRLMAVINTSQTDIESFIKLVMALSPEKFDIGKSLNFKNIYDIKCAYDQAVCAIRYGTANENASIFIDFFDYALDFIIDTADFDAIVHAVNPEVAALWNNDLTNNENDLDTLACYLKNERSLSASAREAGVHKNTFLYRIRKLEGILSKSLDDEYYREYITQSIRILKLNKSRSPY